MWTTFDYTTNSSNLAFGVGSTLITGDNNNTWKSIAYALELSNGYQDLTVTPITHGSGFLIFGYADETQQFTAFILDETNIMQQAYFPNRLKDDYHKYFTLKLTSIVKKFIFL